MKKKYAVLAVSGIITVVIMAVMNIKLIPAIEAGTQGMRFFDMNTFGYTYEAAQTFISSLSDAGKDLALRVQLPLDFVYPVAYTVFFVTLMIVLSGKKTKWAIIPAFLFISDYTENICTVMMLKADVLSSSLCGFASIVTIVKSALMYLTFLIIIIMIIQAEDRKIRKSKKQ